ncbi:MAG: glycyl radical protein [Candidatus Aminicenantes bacterium]
MNQRIKRLRDQSLNTHPSISPQRAMLLTEFYKSERAKGRPVPIQRALAFKHIMEKKSIGINEGELILGERGPAPRATPTYPEITVHTDEDLEILNSREKTSYTVSRETRDVYKNEIYPFWKGRTVREMIFREVPQEWKDAFDAGVFTEFMEQRAPGHTVLDDKIYRKGFLDLKKEIEISIAELDFDNDPDSLKKRHELEAMSIAAGAIIRLAERYSEKAASLAEKENDPRRKQELERLAEICSHVPARAPRNFWEALQHYWFVHLGVITELNGWDSFNPGRLDQHLYPFYKKGLENNSLNKEQARELLQSFWIKFNNQPAPPKVGVTAQESGTYTDFALINTGGVKPDGTDGVNSLSYLILDVIEEMRILQPSSMVQISKKSPDRFLRRALEILKNGFGQPSIFNTEAIIQELLRQGKSIEDARCGGASGCVEIGAFGKENYTLTGYFNLVKILEITLNNGKDPRTGKAVGIPTGDPVTFTSMDTLIDAFRKQLNYFIDIKIRGNNIVEQIYAENIPAPFLSLLINDCIQKGKDYHSGGARYNTSYIQGVGIGSITDSLASLQYNVFDKKRVSMKDMLASLKSNFEGQEEFRQILINKTPKYGNDDDYADNFTRQVFEIYFQAVNGRPNTKGGTHRINFLPTTVHVYFGKTVGATPNGRKAGEPLSEGISPTQGADTNGPTAVIKSASKIDHIRTGGTLLNQKFNPQLLEDKEGMNKLVKLIRGYFSMDGHHIQLNVVTAGTLRKAQKNPEQFRDLIVRVAGYSDYFCDLSVELQNEIIARTEHRET